MKLSIEHLEELASSTQGCFLYPNMLVSEVTIMVEKIDLIMFMKELRLNSSIQKMHRDNSDGPITIKVKHVNFKLITKKKELDGISKI